MQKICTYNKHHTPSIQRHNYKLPTPITIYLSKPPPLQDFYLHLLLLLLETCDQLLIQTPTPN